MHYWSSIRIYFSGTAGEIFLKFMSLIGSTKIEALHMICTFLHFSGLNSILTTDDTFRLESNHYTNLKPGANLFKLTSAGTRAAPQLISVGENGSLLITP